jgi:dTDP-4-dehydrorhamnose reductase
MDRGALERVVAQHDAWAVINAAGYVRVDDAEDNVDACHTANAVAPAIVAAECAHAGVGYAWFSSDLVFAGRAQRPYVEDARVGPRNVYGRAKALGERRVADAHPGALIVRTSSFFGHDDDANFIVRTLRDLDAGRRVEVAADLIMSPTYVPDLVDAVLDLVIDGDRGIWHLANDGACTWEALAREAARACGVAPRRLTPVPVAALGWRAPRPRYTALGTRRGIRLPSLDDALARFADAWSPASVEEAAGA